MTYRSGSKATKLSVSATALKHSATRNRCIDYVHNLTTSKRISADLPSSNLCTKCQSCSPRDRGLGLKTEIQWS